MKASYWKPWETIEWFALLGITPILVLFDGIFDEKAVRALWSSKNCGQNEGYVVRLSKQFRYGEFRHKAAKFVRKGHIQTAKH